MLAKYRYLPWVFSLLCVIASNSFAGGWEQVTELPIWRYDNAAAVIDGKIYVLGGYTWRWAAELPPRFVRSIEEYNPKTDEWCQLPDMPMFKGWFATVAVDNEIYTLGGMRLENGLAYISDVDVYNPTILRC